MNLAVFTLAPALSILVLITLAAARIMYKKGWV